MTDGSSSRFPDGGSFLEIPSVEGPESLQPVLGEARRYALTIHRVSQGSGIAMLADSGITEMVAQCTAASVELCLFLGPRGKWDPGGADSSAGRITGARVRENDQLRYSIEDPERAVGLGVRCILVADEDVLWQLHTMRSRGIFPAVLTLKMSALAGPTNPASFTVVQHVGADSINVPSDLSVIQLSELRRAASAAIDFYIECPDGLGGIVRHHDAPALVRAAAPYISKFGLRNSAELYSVGAHLQGLAIATARKRVRRAHLAMELLKRHEMDQVMSPPGARDIGRRRAFYRVSLKTRHTSLLPDRGGFAVCGSERNILSPPTRQSPTHTIARSTRGHPGHDPRHKCLWHSR